MTHITSNLLAAETHSLVGVSLISSAWFFKTIQLVGAALRNKALRTKPTKSRKVRELAISLLIVQNAVR
jgi:hypothetical protein